MTLEFSGPIRIFFKEIERAPDWNEDPRFAARATEITIRGKPGVLLDPAVARTGGQRILHWTETHRVIVSMVDVNGRFSNEGLIRMAESMRV